MVSLETYRRLAAALPGAVEQIHSGMPAFAVGKSRFSIFDPKKGELALRVPLTDSVRMDAHAKGWLATAPGRYGAEGWAMVDLDRIGEGAFARLLEAAHLAVSAEKRKAPAMSARPNPATATGSADEAFGTLREICLALAGSHEEPHFEKPSFRVGTKIFATWDAKKRQACFKFSPEEQARRCRIETGIVKPVPGRWGESGWTLADVDRMDPPELADLARTAWSEVSRGAKPAARPKTPAKSTKPKATTAAKSPRKRG